jgi:4-hydroxybenzoate polyprenyltransferase
MLGCLVWTGWLFGLHAPYYLSLLAVALWFVWDLIRLNNAHSDQASTAFKVFVQNHWIGVLVLVGIAVDYAII